MSAPEVQQPIAVDQALFTNLTDAITGLRATLTTIANNTATAGTSTTSATPIYDLFDNSKPYNLITRTGMEAMNQSSAPLKMDGIDKWDGNVIHFPNFLMALKDRFQECNWNANDASGIRKIKITTIDGSGASTTVEKDILEDYHSLTVDQLKTAFAAITDDRAKQNLKAMFLCSKSSISGDIKTTTFDTPDNQPQLNNGWAILKSFTDSTTVASLTVAIKAGSKLLEFNPSTHSYNIPIINKELNRLFILATTPQRKFSQMERIQTTITTYDRIKQPYEWTLWIKEVKRDFTKNKLTNCQDIMNEGVTTYNTIKEEDTTNTFTGSLKTVQEDIVAMLADKIKPAAPKDGEKKRKASNRSPRNDEPKKDLVGPAPFLKHTHVNDDPKGREYVLGDNRQWNKETYYFCPTPTHKNGLRWHRHKPDECTIRKRFVAESKPAANAAIADAPEIEEGAPGTESAPDVSPAPATAAVAVEKNITALLASCLSATKEGSITHELLAEALESL